MKDFPLSADWPALSLSIERIVEATEELRQRSISAKDQLDEAVQQVMLRGIARVERVKQVVDARVEAMGPQIDDAMLRGVRQVERVRDAVDGQVDAISLQLGPKLEKTRSWWRAQLRSVVQWIDSSDKPLPEEKLDRVDWLRVLPFIGVHIACIGVFFVPFSWFAVGFGVFMYLLRMHAITAWYHRYFSHKAFKSSRLYQFLWAIIGATSAQRGPLWWAAHHRNHHRYSDTAKDLHSPREKGFWMAHMGWFMTGRGFVTHHENIADLEKFPELRWIDRFDVLFPIALGFVTFSLGKVLAVVFPELGVTGGNLLFWGFFVSTIVLFHGTVTINSLSHTWGSRRYATSDDSRNNWFLAIVTLGEGWHNNHHHYPGSANQGFYWWEYDISYYLLKASSWAGLVWDLKRVPPALLEARRIKQ